MFIFVYICVVIKICSFSVWWSSPTRNRWSTLLTRWTGQNWEGGKSRFLRRNRQALEAEGDPGPGRQGGNKRWQWILLSRKMKNCSNSLISASFFNPILGREAHAEGQGAVHRCQQAETIIFILTIFWPSSPCKFGKVCQDQLES